MKKRIILLLTLPLLALSACTPNSSSSEQTSSSSLQPMTGNYNKVISPSGAPAICFYDQALTGNFETNSTPANVAAQLLTDNYGMVVFDFYNGLKSIKNNNADFKLARILTGGNLYLVGIDKTTAPTSDDTIVSFGQNLLPDLAYKKLYSQDIIDNTTYVNAVTDAAAVLASGVYEGEKVDYVVIAQPVLFATMTNKSAPTHGRLTVIESLRDKWKQTYNQDAIPQAGLFVHNDYYEANREYFETQFALLDERIDTAINDVITVKSVMDEQIPDLNEQKAFFGFNSNVAKNVQDNASTPNGFALVSADETANINIQAFLNTLGINEDYSDYIL